MKLFYSLIWIIICGCGLRTTTLPSGVEKIAVNSKVYSNKKKFDPSLLKVIDTSVIYEESYTFSKFYDSRNFPDPHNKKSNPYFSFRFYGNGCFNMFGLDKQKQIMPQDFNPELTGWRGIFYRNKSKIMGDLIVPVSGSGSIGILKITFTSIGDTIFVKYRHSDLITAYSKKKLSNKYLSYKATW